MAESSNPIRCAPVFTENVVPFPSEWRLVLHTVDGKRFRGKRIFQSRESAKEAADLIARDKHRMYSTLDGEILSRDIAWIDQVKATGK